MKVYMKKRSKKLKELFLRCVVLQDLFPMIDMKGRRKYADTLQIVPSDPAAPFFDHSVASPTFEDKIREEINSYFKALAK